MWPKIEDKSLKILRTERAFKVKKKAFFIIYKGLSAAKNCLRPESASLTEMCNLRERNKEEKRADQAHFQC